MRQFRIFEHVEPFVIEKIWKHLGVKNFVRNQTIYQEGIDEVDGIYFVSEGEFEIYQKFDENPARKNERTARRVLAKVVETSPEGVNSM